MGALQHESGVGRDKLRSLLRELESAGYLIRRCVQGSGGRWQWISEVSDTPIQQDGIVTENPQVPEPGPEVERASERGTRDGFSVDGKSVDGRTVCVYR